MYLIDTDVISEARKGEKANAGVRRFFARIQEEEIPVYLSAITVGELRRGVEIIRLRDDLAQAKRLEAWLQNLLDTHEDCFLGVDTETAQMWGKLRAPHPENALDKQIAATALMYDLIVVTRNEAHFRKTGAKILNPFETERFASG